jgi:predicted dehydrogenase
MMAAGSPGSPRDTLAVIGGGRWARVIASVLANMDLPFNSTIIVSQSNPARLASALASDRRGPIAIVPTIGEALNRFGLKAAIIANAARVHVASAEQLIEAGIPVLIEKPAALTMAEAARLLELADANGVCVAPSLSFLHCSYLHRFAMMIGADKGKLRGLTLEWTDPTSEVRYDDPKSYDPGISVAQDVMPHVWSILGLAVGMPAGDVGVKSCRIARGGRWATYGLEVQGVPCLVTVRRDAPARRRFLKAEISSGEELAIDFTVEPGTILSGSTRFSADPGWTERPGPLWGQIQDFLAALKGRTAEPDTHALLGSVGLVERCDALLKQRQRNWLRLSRTESELHYALRDMLCGRFYKEGHGRPGDVRALDAWVAIAVRQFRASGGDVDIDSWTQQVSASAGMTLPLKNVSQG